jgi:hypothetical protein
MLLVKSNIFGKMLNAQNMQETNFHLNYSYMCWLEKSCASKYKQQSVLFNYLKRNCSSMFEINKPSFSNSMFSVIV